MSRDDKRIGLDGKVWMTVGGENLGGGNRVELLADSKAEPMALESIGRKRDAAIGRSGRRLAAW